MNKHDYPVDVTEAVNLDFLPYIHKIIKINELLRTGRTHLPELLLTLDQINPLDLMVIHGLVLSAQDDGFNFELAVLTCAQSHNINTNANLRLGQYKTQNWKSFIPSIL